MASASYDGEIKIWDSREILKCIKTFVNSKKGKI